MFVIKFLVKHFIKNSENTENPNVREKYSALGGTLGIICNLFLFGIKLAAGGAMGSIAIVSDAFNNLSDTGSSIISVIGAKLSNMKPDKEHPFGHGRFEYVSSLIVSFIIMLVGFELFKTSFFEIFQGEKVSLSLPMVGILFVCVLVKLWMFSYNSYLGRRIDSGLLEAAAKDSLGDAAATTAVIVTTIIGKFINFPPLDGIIGTAVSVMIVYSGFQIAKDTVNLLLGSPPSHELIKSIESYIMSAEGIVGVHDLIVHDYGPGRVLASVHAEVPDDYDIVKIHEIIDGLEHGIKKELGIETVIHMDPITVNSERNDFFKDQVLEIVKNIDSRMNIHDFRMTDGESNINLIFDVEVPVDYKEKESLKEKIASKLKEKDHRLNAVIDIDITYA